MNNFRCDSLEMLPFEDEHKAAARSEVRDQLNMSEGCYSRPQRSHQRSRDPSKFHVRKIIACGDPK